ncbi:MAG: nucleoside triphosphate pyrophosphatase [Neisseria sp.]|nr:nucleoside triphosphate pyrophosphatase [Neisseria sp.]
MFNGKSVYLASGSPRRREILENLGFHVINAAVNIDERVMVGESPETYVRRMAEEKNRAAWHILPPAPTYPVISADTIVVLNDEILGKPRDAADARCMLQALSDKKHRVLSAVCVSLQQKYNTALNISTVTFAALSPSEINAYIASKEPFDKAGGYGIQGLGGVFVRHLDGSFSGIMGLPIHETVTLLKQYL